MFDNFKELGNFIEESTERFVESKSVEKTPIVYAVSNEGGLIKSTIVTNPNNYKIVREGYFAYNPYRINVGSIALAPKKFYGVVSPAYVVFQCKTELINEYIFSLIKSELGSKLLKYYCDKGSVRSAVSFENLQKIRFYIPSINNQKTFLNNINLFKINENLDKFDEMNFDLKNIYKDFHNKLIYGNFINRSNNSTKEEILTKLKSKKINFLLNEKKEHKLPPNWEIVKLGDIAFVTKLAGFEYTKHFDPKKTGDVRVIRSQNVGFGEFIEKNSLYIEKKISDILKRSKIYGNENLITFIGAGIGNVCSAPNAESHLAPNVAKVVNYYMNHKYLEIFLTSQMGQFLIKNKIKGTKDSLSMKNIRDIEIFVPPINEQKEIISKFNSFKKLILNMQNDVKNCQNDYFLIFDQYKNLKYANLN